MPLMNEAEVRDASSNRIEATINSINNLTDEVNLTSERLGELHRMLFGQMEKLGTEQSPEKESKGSGSVPLLENAVLVLGRATTRQREILNSFTGMFQNY